MTPFPSNRIGVLVCAIVMCVSTSAGAQSWTLERSLATLADDEPHRQQHQGSLHNLLRHPSTPPLLVRVSPQTLLDRLDREVDVTTPVHEFVLGTEATGRAHTRGQLTLQLVPHEERIDFVLVLSGTSVSRTTGYNGPAVIDSSSTSRFTAKKRIIYDDRRGFRAGPTIVSVDTDLDINGIGSTLPGLRGMVVQAVAQRRAGDSHYQAQQIAKQRTGDRVLESFDKHIEAQLAKLNERPFMKQIRQTGSETVEALSPWRVRTTKDWIELAWGPDVDEMHDLPAGLLRESICEVWLPLSLAGEDAQPWLEFWADVRETRHWIFASHSPLAPAIEFGSRFRRLPNIAFTPIDKWIVVQLGPQGPAVPLGATIADSDAVSPQPSLAMDAP